MRFQMPGPGPHAGERPLFRVAGKAEKLVLSCRRGLTREIHYRAPVFTRNASVRIGADSVFSSRYVERHEASNIALSCGI